MTQLPEHSNLDAYVQLYGLQPDKGDAFLEDVCSAYPGWCWQGVSRIEYRPQEFEEGKDQKEKSCWARYYRSESRIVLNSLPYGSEDKLKQEFDGLCECHQRNPQGDWGEKRESLTRIEMAFQQWEDQAKLALAHEIGHHVYGRICGDDQIEKWWENQYEAQIGKGVVNLSCEDNAEETFAELCAWRAIQGEQAFAHRLNSLGLGDDIGHFFKSMFDSNEGNNAVSCLRKWIGGKSI